MILVAVRQTEKHVTDKLRVQVVLCVSGTDLQLHSQLGRPGTGQDIMAHLAELSAILDHEVQPALILIQPPPDPGICVPAGSAALVHN